MPPATYDLSSYGVEHFGGANLGDARPDKSLIDLANRISSRDKQTQDLPATEVVGQEEMEVLGGHYQKKGQPLTVREFFLMLARLGGHQNRKKDHPPGWLVLWRGWQALQLMVAGARARSTFRDLPPVPTKKDTT